MFIFFFQLFSENVISAMKIYQTFDKELEDCDSTVTILKKIRDIILAMTSRCSKNALTPDSEFSQVCIICHIII